MINFNMCDRWLFAHLKKSERRMTFDSAEEVRSTRCTSLMILNVRGAVERLTSWEFIWTMSFVLVMIIECDDQSFFVLVTVVCLVSWDPNYSSDALSISILTLSLSARINKISICITIDIRESYISDERPHHNQALSALQHLVLLRCLWIVLVRNFYRRKLRFCLLHCVQNVLAGMEGKQEWAIRAILPQFWDDGALSDFSLRRIAMARKRWAPVS